MKWEKRPIDLAKVRLVHDQFQIDLLTASILERREVAQDQLKFYLEDDVSYLHNPFLFEDMEIAVDRILEAKTDGEKVRIFGDRDVDGMTSTVLLFEALKTIGIDVDWKLPMEDEPYGLTMNGVKKLIEDDVTLLITVDCGISSTEEVAFATQNSIDSIIMDHHIPGDRLPGAIAIIDPKMEGSGYPFPDLAGCGVVAKFVWALEFSKTNFYKEEVILLHSHPGNQTTIIDAIKLENLVEIDRITEEVVSGVLMPEQSRLFDFLIGKQILVFDEPLEKRMLQHAFGSKVDIHLMDIAPQVYELFPAIKGKSLVRLQQKSKALRYSQNGLGEIDALVRLFNSYILKLHPGISSEYEDKLDLVAIGTVADLMPMKGENRILVKKGLEAVARGNRSSLNTFLYMLNLAGKRISTVNIGWQISPIFNAAGRLGVPDIAVKMLISTEREEQERLATELVQLNKRRKKMGDEAWNRILPKAKKSFEEHEHKIVIVFDKKMSRGITGIMAARLMNLYKVPAMIIAKLEGNLVGSMRSDKSMHIKNFLNLFDDLLLDHGGHQCAGGFSLIESNLDEFMIRVDEAASDLDSTVVEATYYIDAELPVKYMTPDLIKVVERFEPYGVDHSPLQFMLKKAKIEEMSLLGNGEQKHVKMLISYGKHKWPAIFWRAGDRVNTDFSLGDQVDLVFRFGRNYYKNMESLQLTVLDIARDATELLTNI